ncbi:hypothetical protein SAMN04490239_3542 [Rhodococcus koreensis]|uniref:Uncharacterized protein n=1 Tax=Rhodococcus koreensis TaxID=99653 RepID=A0A1H4RA39_9NOCA|nr:hypothetical protein SAMN04490239_3542 [Rhodococcus koreensis]
MRQAALLGHEETGTDHLLLAVRQPQVTSDDKPHYAELRAVPYLAQRRSAAAEIGSPAAARRSHTSAGVPGGLRQAAAVALIA